jgi:ElaA protein
MAAPGESRRAKSDDALASSSPSRRGPHLTWRFAPYAELTPQEIHDLFQVRAAVFVVEQECAFQDVDGADVHCWHLLGYSASPAAPGVDPILAAYCRLVPPGVKFEEPSIGRVVTPQVVRGWGLGRVLMREALLRADRLWPGKAIRIGAQQRLDGFYRDFGFAQASEPYDEDGILHIEMVRAAPGVAANGGSKVRQD